MNRKDTLALVSSWISGLLQRRITHVLLLPDNDEWERDHLPAPLQQVLPFFDLQPHSVTVYPRVGLKFELREGTVNVHCTGRNGGRFGVVVRRADNPELVAENAVDSTVWPLLQEQVLQAIKWERQQRFAMAVYNEVFRQIRGPNDLCRAWPTLLGQYVASADVYAALRPYRSKNLHERLPHPKLRQDWAQVFHAIDGWLAESVGLKQTNPQWATSVIVPTRESGWLPPHLKGLSLFRR